jgi:hypothetical protein
MAWLSLIVVGLVFFSPEIGIGPQVSVQDIPLVIPLPFVSAALRIPFTGPLRLFLESAGAWLILWLIPFHVDRWLGENALKEKKPYKDLLKRIGLWDDLVIAFRPVITDQLATTLAKILLLFVIIKAIVIYLLQAIHDSIVSLLTTWLTSQAGAQFALVISELVGQSLEFLLGLRPNNGVVLVVFCLLVLIANKAYKLERRLRHEFMIRVNQVERKSRQREIAIPATQ